MGRFISFLYGFTAYIAFLGSLLYAIAFVGDFWVAKTIDSGGGISPFRESLLINAGLLGLFAVQHSVMARQGFKRWWTRIIPEHLERSTYVLISSLLLFLLYWQWRPLPETVWSVESEFGYYLLMTLFWTGWAMVVLSTFMINHFDLFGLRQVYLHFKQKEYTPIKFKEPGFYKYMRHPLMFGFLLAFWAAPTMTVGHLVFAIATTGYILIGIWFEEKDLLRFHGEKYQNYRKRVRMLLPFRKGSGKTSK